MISTSILLALTPLGSADFWLTLVALLGLIGMQAGYWLFTHPPACTHAPRGWQVVGPGWQGRGWSGPRLQGGLLIEGEHPLICPEGPGYEAVEALGLCAR
jgi:hypothetical protein